MTRYEIGFMNKCAEHGVDPMDVADFLEKSASTMLYETRRRQRLHLAIKQACLSEKDAAFNAGKLIGMAFNRAGGAVRSVASRRGAKALNPNFVERLGSQLQQQGIRGTARSGFRRVSDRLSRIRQRFAARGGQPAVAPEGVVATPPPLPKAVATPPPLPKAVVTPPPLPGTTPPPLPGAGARTPLGWKKPLGILGASALGYGVASAMRSS